MKKIIYLLVVILSLGACHKENKQKDREILCCNTPETDAIILIDKTLVPEGSLEKFVL
ncbi:hypothetical protein [Capnocytophaga sp. G2]|jgi:hypothetical protein|uniref:hypothetical protein n=1 Tax=Capnocytophaga sp. G2 TaxID=3110695 RepID=UPI002B4A78D4|nr:hypothetical protein [Capnocytophaga sp. G2]MEB3004567.1 hypothetical protein [Capnocytophaga sp. G2]